MNLSATRLSSINGKMTGERRPHVMAATVWEIHELPTPSAPFFRLLELGEILLRILIITALQHLE